MVTVRCPTCGKKIVWDDFQPITIKCSECGETFNVHQALKDNIRRREQEAGRKTYHCPHCRGAISRRWFIRCPECGRYLFGRFTLHGNWLWVATLIIGYLLLTYYYIVFVQ
ncbi:MAG: hypothetical protein J7L53_09080 [Deltaproteobacteria bacterium]|nr:hypothetical protein [Deltaproteobacteria bacterium]